MVVPRPKTTFRLLYITLDQIIKLTSDNRCLTRRILYSLGPRFGTVASGVTVHCSLFTVHCSDPLNSLSLLISLWGIFRSLWGYITMGLYHYGESSDHYGFISLISLWGIFPIVISNTSHKYISLWRVFISFPPHPSRPALSLSCLEWELLLHRSELISPSRALHVCNIAALLQ